MSSPSHFNSNNNNNNNNNYIPNFYNDILPPEQQLIEDDTQMRSFGAPHNFTFSYPTQGATLTNPRASFQASSSMGFLSAPGLGTTWQHSNPSTMPGFSPGSMMNLPIYTGMPSRSEPQPSCSSPMKRPKRKALEYSEDAPSSKVYLCTDQFANLNINPDWVRTRRSSGDQQRQHSNSNIKGQDPVGWSRFQEVESSIELDSQDDKRQERKEKGVLRINEAIVDSMRPPAGSILPTDIVKEISKPCMQLVLWKSPGELVRDLVRDETLSSEFFVDSSPPSPAASLTDSTSSSLSPSSPLRSSSMEVIHSHSHCHRHSPNFTPSATMTSCNSSTEGRFLPPQPAAPVQPWSQASTSSLDSRPQLQSSSSQIPLTRAVSSNHGGSSWNWSNRPPSSSHPPLPLATEDSGLWDNHLDLNATGGDYEEMQL